jgi:hypothetical protein
MIYVGEWQGFLSEGYFPITLGSFGKPLFSSNGNFLTEVKLYLLFSSHSQIASPPVITTPMTLAQTGIVTAFTVTLT